MPYAVPVYTVDSIKSIFEDEYTKNVENIIRFGRNGRKYIWSINELTRQQIVDLMNKYGVEQISDTTIWLETY